MNNNNVVEKKGNQIIITMSGGEEEKTPESIQEQKGMSFGVALLYASGLIAIGWYIIMGWRM